MSNVMAIKEYPSTYIQELSKDPIIQQMIVQLKSNVGERIAYPNVEQYMAIPGAHDTQKWLQTIKEVYYGERNGLPRSHALRQATSNWNVTETYDFLNWLRFYEEGTHLKYKVAQFYYGNADVGYLLPIKQDPEHPKEQSVSGKDIDFARDAAADEMPASEKKRIIERQRHKIIGRLDSAEKLLRSNEGQLFADVELSSLLEAIYSLKKKVQLLNKKSASNTIYSDLIIREANILGRKGFVKAADMLYSLADEPKKDAIPAPPPPAPPAQGEGSVGGLPSVAPGSPETPAPNNAPGTPAEAPDPKSEGTTPPVPPVPPPPAAPQKPKKPTAPALDEFIHNLNTGGSGKSDFKDSNSIEDTLEVMDTNDDLVVEAQAEPEPPAPPPPATEDVPLTPANPEAENLEIKESDVPAPAASAVPTKDIDKMLGAVFSNLTIADVVAKFEDIAKFYKTREMPRQLAMADMMLDSLGLAPFFPALSEATNKALEANNYISTRLEDILSKLRGTMKTRDIDMKNEDAKKVSPEVESAKQSLQEQEESEKSKKKMRKDIEDKAMQMQMKETPEIEVEEDLGGEIPPEVPPPPPAPPPAKPTV